MRRILNLRRGSRLLLLGLALAAPGQEATPTDPVVLLANDSLFLRDETVLVSVPFPPGARRELGDLVVQDRETAWRVLCRWPDGTVRVAQAQFQVRPRSWLRPREVLNLPIQAGKAAAGPFRPHPWVAARLPQVAIGTELKDQKGQVATCPLRSGAGGQVLAATPLVRTTRYRLRHQASGAGSRPAAPLPSLTVYVTEFSRTPILVLDLLLANDGAGGTPERLELRHFDLVGGNVPLLVTYPRRCGVEPSFQDRQGRAHWPLLRDSFLAPGQGRRWRAVALLMVPEAPALPRGIAHRTWQAIALRPLRPLCDAQAWQQSGALTLFGGPAVPPADWRGRVLKVLGRHFPRDHFGPFGTWGRPEQAGRGFCHPAWVRAVQTSRGALLDLLVGQAWQEACRPRRSQGSPAPAHGWRSWSLAEPTSHLLFDTWIATGDWWCRDELARLADCLMARPGKGNAAGEGRLLAVLVQAWLATEEARFKEFSAKRIIEVLRARERREKASPADQGELMLGLLAAWRFFGLREALELAASLAAGLARRGEAGKPPAPLPPALALPLWLVAREPEAPAAARRAAADIGRRLLAGMDEAERRWEWPAFLIPVSR